MSGSTVNPPPLGGIHTPPVIPLQPPPAGPPPPAPITNRAKSETYNFFMSKLGDENIIPKTQQAYEKGLPINYKVDHEFKKDSLGQPVYTLVEKGGKHYVALHVTFTLKDEHGNTVNDRDGHPIVKETTLYTTFTVPPLASQKDIANVLKLAMAVALPHALKIRGALNEGSTELHGNDIGRRNALIQSLMKSSFSSVTFKHTQSTGAFFWKKNEEKPLNVGDGASYVKFSKIEKIILHAEGMDFDIDASRQPMMRTMRSVDQIRNMHFARQGQTDLTNVDPQTRRELRLNELDDEVNRMARDNRTNEISGFIRNEETVEAARGETAVPNLQSEWKKERANVLEKRMKQFDELQRHFVDPKKIENLSRMYGSNLDANTMREILAAKNRGAELPVLEGAMRGGRADPQGIASENSEILDQHSLDLNLYDNLADLAKQLKTLKQQIEIDQTVLASVDPAAAQANEAKIRKIDQQMAAIERVINPGNTKVLQVKMATAKNKEGIRDAAGVRKDQAEAAHNTAKNNATDARAEAVTSKQAMGVAEEAWEASKNPASPKPLEVQREFQANFNRLAAVYEQKLGHNLIVAEKRAEETLKEAQVNFNNAAEEARLARQIANEARKENIYAFLPEQFNNPEENKGQILSSMTDWLQLPSRDFSRDQPIIQQLARTKFADTSHVVLSYIYQEANQIKLARVAAGNDAEKLAAVARQADKFSQNLAKLATMFSQDSVKTAFIENGNNILNNLTRVAGNGQIDPQELQVALMAFGRVLELSTIDTDTLPPQLQQTVLDARQAIGPGAVYNPERIQTLTNPAPSNSFQVYQYVQDWLASDPQQSNPELDKQIATALVNKLVRRDDGTEELFISNFIRNIDATNFFHQPLDALLNKLSETDIAALKANGPRILNELIYSAKNDDIDPHRHVKLQMALHYLAREGIVDLARADAANLTLPRDVLTAIRLAMIGNGIETTLINDQKNALIRAPTLANLREQLQEIELARLQNQNVDPALVSQFARRPESYHELKDFAIDRAVELMLHSNNLPENDIQGLGKHFKDANMSKAYQRVLNLTGFSPSAQLVAPPTYNDVLSLIKDVKTQAKTANARIIADTIDLVDHSEGVPLPTMDNKQLTASFKQWLSRPYLDPGSTPKAATYLLRLETKPDSFFINNIIREAADANEVRQGLNKLLFYIPAGTQIEGGKMLIKELAKDFVEGRIDRAKFEASIHELGRIIDLRTLDDLSLTNSNKPNATIASDIIRARLGPENSMIDILKSIEGRTLTQDNAIAVFQEWLSTNPSGTQKYQNEASVNKAIITKFMNWSRSEDNVNLGHLLNRMLQTDRPKGEKLVKELFAAFGAENAIKLLQTPDRFGRTPLMEAAQARDPTLFRAIFASLGHNTPQFHVITEKVLSDAMDAIIARPGLRGAEKPDIDKIAAFLLPLNPTLAKDLMFHVQSQLSPNKVKEEMIRELQVRLANPPPQQAVEKDIGITPQIATITPQTTPQEVQYVDVVFPQDQPASPTNQKMNITPINRPPEIQAR